MLNRGPAPARTLMPALVSLLLSSLSGSALAAAMMPTVSKSIPAQSTGLGAGAITLSLGDYFKSLPVDDQVVRMTYQSPVAGMMNLDFALFSTATPLTRANFLSYVTSGAYNRSLLHRFVPGFILQGGGVTVSSNGTPSYIPVPPDSTVQNEFGISNTAGTVAMAKVDGDPNSATDQWFINLADNSANLDAQNGGFTVFATVTKSSQAVVAALSDPTSYKIYNYMSPLDSLPIYKDYSGSGGVPLADLIIFSTVALAPMNAGDAATDGVLTYSISQSISPSFANVSVQGGSLVITPNPGVASGQTVVTVAATDSVGNVTRTSFLVTQTALTTYAAWRTANFSATDAANDAVSGPNADPDGDGIPNLQLFMQGYPAGRTLYAPVTKSTIASDGTYHAKFVFPVRNDIAGSSYSIEKSTSLVDSASWTAVATTLVSSVTSGNINTVTLQTTDAASSPSFYRLRFTAP